MAGTSGMALMPPDEIDVSQIDKNAQTLPQNENDIFSVYSIGEDDQSTCQAEVPEGFRYDAFPCALAGDPLIDKAHHEHALTKQAKRNPRCELGFEP